MFITVKKAAQILDTGIHRVYCLLAMGEMEAVKIGRHWRLSADAVDEYAQRHPERKIIKPADHFIYPGSGGHLFCYLPDCLPVDTRGEAAGVERRRRQLVRGPQRPGHVLRKKFKPVTQLELFVI